MYYRNSIKSIVVGAFLSISGIAYAQNYPEESALLGTELSEADKIAVRTYADTTMQALEEGVAESLSRGGRSLYEFLDESIRHALDPKSYPLHAPIERYFSFRLVLLQYRKLARDVIDSAPKSTKNSEKIGGGYHLSSSILLAGIRLSQIFYAEDKARFEKNKAHQKDYEIDRLKFAQQQIHPLMNIIEILPEPADRAFTASALGWLSSLIVQSDYKENEEMMTLVTELSNKQEAVKTGTFIPKRIIKRMGKYYNQIAKVLGTPKFEFKSHQVSAPQLVSSSKDKNDDWDDIPLLRISRAAENGNWLKHFSQGGESDGFDAFFRTGFASSNTTLGVGTSGIINNDERSGAFATAWIQSYIFAKSATSTPVTAAAKFEGDISVGTVTTGSLNLEGELAVLVVGPVAELIINQLPGLTEFYIKVGGQFLVPIRLGGQDFLIIKGGMGSPFEANGTGLGKLLEDATLLTNHIGTKIRIDKVMIEGDFDWTSINPDYAGNSIRIDRLSANASILFPINLLMTGDSLSFRLKTLQYIVNKNEGENFSIDPKDPKGSTSLELLYVFPQVY